MTKTNGQVYRLGESVEKIASFFEMKGNPLISSA